MSEDTLLNLESTLCLISELMILKLNHQIQCYIQKIQQINQVINQSLQKKLNQIEVIIITILVENEEFKIYGYIQIDKIDVQVGFIYQFTKIQVGTMLNQFCGIMTIQTKIFCDKAEIQAIEKQKQLQWICQLKGKSNIELEPKEQNFLNPFIINLLNFFQKDEFQLNGIMLYKLKQKLINIKVSTIVGFIYKINSDQKKILSLGIIEEISLTPCEIDLQYIDIKQTQKFIMGAKISFQNLQKQSRVIQNSFKGFIEDQQILEFEQIDLGQNPSFQGSISQLKIFKNLPYSQLEEISQYSIDRKLRKYKIDILRTNQIQFQYTCKHCNGCIKIRDEIQFICEACKTSTNLEEVTWEIFAILKIKIGTQEAILKLKDKLVLEFFDIHSIYVNFMQQYSLKSQYNQLRQENIEGDEYLKNLYEICYKQQVKKEILAYAYCDFIKTAKIKDKWKQIRKQKEVDFNELNLDIGYKFNDYQIWIEKNEQEKLVIYPNGSFEICEKKEKGQKWYENRELKPIICLECFGVQDVDFSYVKLLQSLLN